MYFYVVCMYVYLRLCVSGSAASQTGGSILMKFSTNNLTDICEVCFSRIFEISKSMTSLQPFCPFTFAALSRSQFCFGFLQNLTQDRKLSSAVCCLKISKFVCNFRQYSGPRLRKKSKWPLRFFFKTRQVRCLFRTKLSC